MSETELLLQSLSDAAGICDPDCERASNAQEDYDASQSAALVAVNLIRSARIILKLDPVDTHYSAQYLVDKAGKEDEEGEMDPQRCAFTLENILGYLVETVLSKKEDGEGEMVPQRRHLTVKECLQFAFKKGLPRSEHWAHLGCTFKVPPFASLIPLVPIKGEVIEAKTVDEALELLMQQPVGARLHVFSPEFDRAGEEGIYNGPSDGTSYVGLRDVIICAVKTIEGKPVVTVQICYKKKTLFVSVCVRSIILPLNGGDESQTREPSGLLVDFCIPRLSVN